MDNEVRVWGIHTMDDNLFLNKNIIGLGWNKMGSLSLIPSDREAYKKAIANAYPNMKSGAIPTSAGMLYRFACEVQIGDYIVYPSKIDKKINIGQVEGEYYYDPSTTEYVHQRKVKWIRHYSRTLFTQGALYEVGSAMSFFAVKNYSDEYLAALDNDFKKNSISLDEPDATIAATAESIIESTKDYIIKELSRQLKGYDLEQFVANLLDSMGYRTTVSKKGGDSGIDIIAYKDELPPRILVQVKSQDGDIKESTIQSLKGTMREGDYGLFVTLSDYTKNAKNYLKNTPIIRGINGNELVDLIIKYYDKLDEKYKKMIPLKMVYIPMAEESSDIEESE